MFVLIRNEVVLKKHIYRFLYHTTYGKTKEYFKKLYYYYRNRDNGCDENKIKYSGNGNKVILYKPDGTIEENPDFILGLSILFCGNNSVVKIHQPNHFTNCILRIGTHNLVEIGATNMGFTNLQIPVTMRENCQLLIGKNCVINGCNIYLHDEPGTIVKIGDDCMFSFGITIWPADGHAIEDEKGNLVNFAENITIGDHVWLGMDCKILKGANVPSGAIVAAASIYTKGSLPPHTHTRSYTGKIDNDKNYIFAGVPARVVKEGYFKWHIQNCYDLSKAREKHRQKNVDKTQV